MNSKGFFGTISLIVIGVVFGVVLVSSFGWDRPSMAEVQLGTKTPPVKQVNLDAQAFSDAFVEVSEKVTPSIVKIKVVATAKAQPQNNPFKFFFDHPEIDKERKQQGGGSGVIISDDGYIITNNHVVENATQITVELSSRESFDAVVVGADPMTDLAVIKIKAENLPAVYLGDSDNVKVGQWVMAIGNPLSYLTSTVTAGIVSARGRNLNLIRDNEGYGIEDFIQTDAVINPGNSGGALVDLTGAVIGINAAIATNGFSGSYIGYGFAIPINLTKSVVEDLIAHGAVTRGYIGVRIGEVDASMAKAMGLEKPQGVLISGVVDDGAASKADIEPGDVILKVDDKLVDLPNQLQSYIATRRAGDEVNLEIYRDGKTINRLVVLKARDEGTAVEIADNMNKKKKETELDRKEVELNNIGLTVRNMKSAEHEKYDVESGIMIVDSEEYGVSYNQRLGKGLVISEVNKKSIDSISEFEKIIDSKKGDAVLLKIVYPSGDISFVGLEIPTE